MVLLDISESLKLHVSKIAYVGDSMARDILMAKRANVLAIYAAYGSVQNKELYKKLVRITHWTNAEVENEIRLQEEARSVKPDYILNKTFDEILTPLKIF